jgi:hypothetical protein
MEAVCIVEYCLYIHIAAWIRLSGQIRCCQSVVCIVRNRISVVLTAALFQDPCLFKKFYSDILAA